VQIRGYALRLPLDVLLIASANPEDYTNRGRIITPLKDRFGAEVRTHYPLRLSDEVGLVEQEASLAATVPAHLLDVVARFTRLLRESTAIDQRSGISARFAIAGTETVAASALRRAAITGEADAVARVCDLSSIVDSLQGKVEFEVSEEGRERDVLVHLLRRAVAETFRAKLGTADLSGLLARFEEGATVESGDLVPAAELLKRVGPVPGLAKVIERLGTEGGEDPGQAAAAIEFALEGLYLTRRLSKDEVPGRTVYGG
jgi:magnesium chelatase subunit I